MKATSSNHNDMRSKKSATDREKEIDKITSKTKKNVKELSKKVGV